MNEKAFLAGYMLKKAADEQEMQKQAGVGQYQALIRDKAKALADAPNVMGLVPQDVKGAFDPVAKAIEASKIGPVPGDFAGPMPKGDAPGILSKLKGMAKGKAGKAAGIAGLLAALGLGGAYAGGAFDAPPPPPAPAPEPEIDPSIWDQILSSIGMGGE